MAERDNPGAPRHQPQLTAVAEKTLQPTKCKPGGSGTLAYCPTMDLIALAAEDEQLHVFRLNGQRVFGGSFGGDPYLDEDAKEKGEIRAMKWKNNGHLLAVACGDGSIRLISSYSGKTVHHYPAGQQEGDASSQEGKPPAKITCLGWGVNFTDSKAAQRHLQSAGGQLSVEDLLSPDMQPSKAAAYMKADLPRELALLDIESSLPKLSTLPGTGSDDDVFSSRASIDAIFHSNNKNTSDTVDVLFVGFDDGTIHLRIFDCFEIGSLQVGSSAGGSSSCRALRHASHPMSSTHALLVSAPASEERQKSLSLLTLDLRFITKSGLYLSLLASKTTQLQNLLRYINQVQRQIQVEWKNALDLPTRYMRNINEDLQEKCHCDFVTAAYHLAVTGHCFDPLKEFLVDIVGERGHKRWEKAVSTGYENVRRLTHECLLPALERAEVILSRLMGLSKFHKLSGVLGLETRDLKAIVDTADCLHLLCHMIIIYTNQELAQFLAFSKWLRHEIDIQSAEPMSQTLEELMEKTDMIDHPQTLKYMRGPMTNSALQDFIQPLSGIFAKPQVSNPEKWWPSDDSAFFDTYKKLLKQQKEKEKEKQKPYGQGDVGPVDMPKLSDFVARMERQCDKVFGQIALTQRRGILHRSSLVLQSDCDEAVIDITMRYEDAGEDRYCSVYIAAKSVKSKHKFYIYRIALDSVNGVSSTKSTAIATLSLREGEIRQIQFVEDDTIMLLWTDGAGSSYLLNFPFRSSTATQTDSSAAFVPTYFDIDPTTSTAPPAPDTPTTSLDMSDDSIYASLVKHVFPASGPKAKPVRMDVNGRKGRRAVCVLYADRARYDVLDIDGGVQEEEEQEKQEKEGGNDEEEIDQSMFE